ncbi:MAG: hypothetical protein HY900_36275 [Deltaproteobacteria bacterium]|nr:hypothetical protein [Deltaproteobacteria bacterium]
MQGVSPILMAWLCYTGPRENLCNLCSVPKSHTAGASGSEGIPEKASVGAHFTMGGDVSLEYAVEALNREGKSTSLTALSRALGSADN